MTPDVNVLVAASRTDHPHHAVARDWLEEAISASGAGAALTLMPMVLASFLRLVRLCLDRQLGSNDVPDAWLSAAVVQMGEHLVSFDRGFRKLLPRGQFTLLAPG